MSVLSEECVKEQGNLSHKEWDAKIKYRGIDFKYVKQLDEAALCYEEKIPLIRDELIRISLAKSRPDLFPDIPVDSEQSLIDKLARLKEKYACVVKEQEFRKTKQVKRKLHGTVYYIDLDSGDDGNDGLSTGNAWLTIEKYTTTTVRSAGDIAWVRANTDEVCSADVAFDEDGDGDDFIEIRGCSSAGGEDPWSDGSDVKPIIDFGDGAYRLYIYTDDFWRLYRLDVKDSSSSSANVYAYASEGIEIDSCHIHGNSNSSTGAGYQATYSRGCVIKNSAFDDNYRFNVSCNASSLYIENCTFDGGGTNSTDYGVYSTGFCYVLDCIFGGTNTHDTSDCYVSTYNGFIETRNCEFNSSTKYSMTADSYFLWLTVEDAENVKGASINLQGGGVVSRDSSVQLDSLDSAKMAPTSQCALNTPMTLDPRLLKGDYQIWCPASETTITIKARETAAWTSDPSASEFYFEAEYLDEAATSGHRARQASAQSLSGTSEISFTMTFTPTQAGWVYVTCYLKKYEAGKSVNVSVKPTIS